MSLVQPKATWSPEPIWEEGRPGSFTAEPNEMSRGNRRYWEASSSVPFSLLSHLTYHPPRDTAHRKGCRLVPLDVFYMPTSYAFLLD